MNILVKGMKMPKNCLECVFYRKTDPIYDYCCISTVVPKGYVPEDCPLVEVPTPHGRLIDKNELVKSIHDDWDDVIVWDESGVTTANEFERLVYEQPTIIEAEEGDR